MGGVFYVRDPGSAISFNQYAVKVSELAAHDAEVSSQYRLPRGLFINSVADNRLLRVDAQGKMIEWGHMGGRRVENRPWAILFVISGAMVCFLGCWKLIRRKSRATG